MKKVILKDVAKIVIGISAPKKFIEKNELNAVPFIRAGLLENLCNGKAEFIEFLDKLKYKTVPKNTIIFAKSGMSALKDRVFCLNEESVIVGHLAGVICSDKVYYKYIEYYLKYNKPSKLNQNDSYPSIRTEDIENIILMLPELEEQKEISHKLDSLKNIITIRKQQIESLEQLVKSQFVELFGDAKSNDKNWIKDVMGKYLTILTDFSSNGSYKSLDSTVKMYDEPNYAYMVRTIDLENEDYKNNVKYITEDAYNFLSKSKVYPNDIIMNKIGSAGKVYIMPDLGMPVSLGRNAFLFRYTNEINPVFIYYLLKSDYGVTEIAQYVRGAVTKTITKDDARKIKIIVPPIELQNQFAEFVKLIDKQKFEIEKSLKEMEELYDSLMEEYFG